jgi:HNH endonuclease/NUMOD4 motif
MREVWRDIEGWPLHQVSNNGRVRALSGAQVGRGVARQIVLRKISRMLNGYLVVGNGLYVHRLVLLAFRGKPPRGSETRHLNGKGDDNRLSNLQWGPRSVNQADRVRHGTSNHGERNGQAKLTTEVVQAIREAKGSRGLINDLAQQYGVSHSAISMIRSGKRWRQSHA